MKEDGSHLLFTPVRIGALEIPNRFYLAPMSTLLSAKGNVTQALVDYYVRRASGGAGLVIVESSYVHVSGSNHENALGICSDAQLEGFVHLVERVHNEGARVGLQLFHAGLRTEKRIIGAEPLGPSVHEGPTGTTGRMLSAEELPEVADWYVRAARRAVAAGFDLLELHMAHGYLLHQFLSPLYNRRNDRYGGTPANTQRFPLEVLHAVKSACGDRPVSVRLSVGDLMTGGLTADDVLGFVGMLRQNGAAAINVSAGTNSVAILPKATSRAPFGYLLPLARRLRETVGNLPLMVSGRMHDPALAAAAISNGDADMIGLGRALLADPELPCKVRQGQAETIRQCVYGNYCYRRIKQEQPIACVLDRKGLT